MTLRLPDPLYGTLALIVAILLFATAGASLSNPMRPRLRDVEVRVHIRMWWYIVGGFFLALIVSRTLAVVALGVVSFVAF
jgi:phosphatidate cytidylyltransferase